MRINRRVFLSGAAGAGALAGATRQPGDFSSLRQDFPWALNQTYLNSAGVHPLSRASAAAMQRYLAFRQQGPGEGRSEFGEAQLDELRALFARLINARPSEIAFVQSTLMGENLVVAGLGLPATGGNVVTDELHYNGSLYLYKSLTRAGLDLRIVKHRDWRIGKRDLERAVDRKTRLVATTLVSNINGFQHDARALSELAHAHGARVYLDIVQAAGVVPIDMRASGVDFAACSTYKWLMGERGLGYLYVREDLQGSVLKTALFGDRQYDNFLYHRFPHAPPGSEDMSWQMRSGGHRYEVGNLANVVAAGQREALRFLLDTGVENVARHSRPLLDRLIKEIPPLGYPSITPREWTAPMATFLVKDPAPLQERLRRARVVVKVKWNQMRVSPSIFNNQQDIDRLLEALA